MCANEQKTTGGGSAVAAVALVWSTFTMAGAFAAGVLHFEWFGGSAVAAVALVWSTFTMAGAFAAGVLLFEWFGYLGSWHTPLALLIGALLATIAIVDLARD